jgi:hypothetical protein
MIGHTNADPEEKFYMVDLDQKIREGPPEQTYYMALYRVFNMISKIEATTNNPLTSARAALREQIDSAYQDISTKLTDEDANTQLAGYRDSLHALLDESIESQ